MVIFIIEEMIGFELGICISDDWVKYGIVFLLLL